MTCILHFCGLLFRFPDQPASFPFPSAFLGFHKVGFPPTYMTHVMSQLSQDDLSPPFKKVFVFHVYKCFAYMYACVPCMSLACGDAKRVAEPLEWGVQMW